MIALASVRSALRDALIAAGYNYSDGGDQVPLGASVDPFVCQYHETISGAVDVVSASTIVRITTDRADETSAMQRLDGIMSDVPPIIEHASGPWRAVLVVSATVSNPVQVGDAIYATADFVVQFYV